MPRLTESDKREWEHHKSTIKKLYLEDDFTLDEVLKTMKTDFNFCKTKGQYEGAFGRWGFKKNLTASKWQSVDRRLKKRKRDNPDKETEVMIGDITVSSKKLKKALSRYNFQTTHQRLHDLYHRPESPKTPPGVVIRSPQFRMATLARSRPLVMPYLQYLEFLQSVSVPFGSTLIYLPQSVTTPIFVPDTTSIEDGYGGSRAGHVELVCSRPQTKLEWLQERVTESLYTNLEEEYVVRTFRSSDLFPSINGTPLSIDIKALLDLQSHGSQLELLKLTVGLLSNNNGDGRVEAVLVELCEIPENLKFFRRLLNQRLPSFLAAAESLLVPAVCTGNLNLVKMLIECGINPNRHGYFDGSHISTPLIAAIDSSRKRSTRAVAEYLVEHGADIQLEYYPSYKPALEYAAGKGSLEIFECLFNRISASNRGRRNVCFIMQEAAQHGNIQALDFLIQKGFDVNATDTNGLGSALAAACSRYNSSLMKTIKYLLSKGAHTTGVSANIEFISQTALQASLIIDGFELVEELLSSDADPNYVSKFERACKTPPILLAARYCNVKTIRLLLEHNADLHREGQGCKCRYCMHRRNVCALQCAYERGDSAMADLLMEYGAELPAQQSAASWDPLESAFIGGNDALIDSVRPRLHNSTYRQHLLQILFQRGKTDWVRKFLHEGIFRVGVDTHSAGVIFYAIALNTKSQDRTFIVDLVARTIEVVGSLDAEVAQAGLAASCAVHDRGLIELFLGSGARPCSVSRNIKSAIRHRYHPEVFLPLGLPAFRVLLERCKDREHHGVKDMAVSLIGACATSHSLAGNILECRNAMAEGFVLACSEGMSTSILQLFLDAGVDVNRRVPIIGRGTGTAFQLVLDWDFKNNPPRSEKTRRLVKFLLKNGADANCEAVNDEYDPESKASHAPLQYAVQGNDIDLVRLFMKYGADVNAKPCYSEGATALQFAAINGNFEIVNLLLEHGADINAERSEYDGRTAVEGAAEWGRLDMVCYLLQKGADVKGKDNAQYRRSIYRAWKEGYRTIAIQIQRFKKERYGPDDVCSIDEIVASMTEDELYGDDSDGDDSDSDSYLDCEDDEEVDDGVEGMDDEEGG